LDLIKILAKREWTINKAPSNFKKKLATVDHNVATTVANMHIEAVIR